MRNRESGTNAEEFRQIVAPPRSVPSKLDYLNCRQENNLRTNFTKIQILGGEVQLRVRGRSRSRRN